jgi:hypothetical protein
MLDKELKKIIKEKCFKNFWQTYDYLLLTGYSEIEGFGICLEIYGENKIWDDVAFVRGEKTKLSNIYSYNSTDGEQRYMIGSDPYDSQSGQVDFYDEITVGVINKNTEHLRKLFRFYAESCANDVMIFDVVKNVKDFENLCDEKYTYKLPKIILEYLIHTSKLHYGFNIFNDKQSQYIIDKNSQYPIGFDTETYTTTSTND